MNELGYPSMENYNYFVHNILKGIEIDRLDRKIDR